MRSTRNKGLTALQHYESLKCSSISRGSGKRIGKKFWWECSIQPTPLSRLYNLRITFEQGGAPEVVVLSPDLTEIAGDRKIPHVYGQSPTRLCLYLPGAREWTGHMNIVSTIIPWANLWLLYFEEWLSSGEWKGGGVHPLGPKNE